MNVELLYAERVAAEDQTLVTLIPKREGENPCSRLEDVWPVVREHVQERLGVRRSAKANAARFEAWPKVLMVVEPRRCR